MQLFANSLIRWCRTRLRTPVFYGVFDPAVLLMIAALFSSTLNAQELDAGKAQRIAERPDAGGMGTEVTGGVFLIDIDEIDDVNQRFHVDMFFNIARQDTRLALPAEERSGQVRIFPMSEVWNPRGLIVNDRGLTQDRRSSGLISPSPSRYSGFSTFAKHRGGAHGNRNH